MNISEIAQRAGVSRATVSRVLNDFPNIKDETRSRVTKVIEETNYIPSAAARSLVSQKSNIIGVMIYNLTQPFWAGMIDGIEDGVAHSNYDLFFVNSKSHLSIYDVEKSYKRNLNNLIRRDVDGIIISLVNDLENEDIELLHRTNMPYVVIQNNLERDDVVSVNVDNIQGAAEATRYLIGLGHRAIGHVTGPINSTIAKHRLQGYLQAMQEAGLEVNNSHVVPAGHLFNDGYWAMKKVLSLPQRPTALYFSSDTASWGGVHAAREEGIRIPEDLSIIGFDGVAKQLDYMPLLPNLTTMRQPVQEMGELAVKMLLEWLGGHRPSPASVMMPAALILGDTCKYPASGIIRQG